MRLSVISIQPASAFPRGASREGRSWESHLPRFGVFTPLFLCSFTPDRDVQVVVNGPKAPYVALHLNSENDTEQDLTRAAQTEAVVKGLNALYASQAHCQNPPLRGVQVHCRNFETAMALVQTRGYQYVSGYHSRLKDLHFKTLLQLGQDPKSLPWFQKAVLRAKTLCLRIDPQAALADQLPLPQYYYPDAVVLFKPL